MKYVCGENVPPANLIGARGLVNTFEYYHPAHPASFDVQDPVLPVKNQNTFNERGVLVMSPYWDETERIAEQIRPGSKDLIRSHKLMIGETDFSCCAPLGKEKRWGVYLLYLAPLEKTVSAPAKTAE